MSSAFGLWITSALAPPKGRAGTLLEGVALGRFPEPGQSLTYRSPFCPPLPLHFSGLTSAPRGGESSLCAITIREPFTEARRLIGGFVVETGIKIWPMAARLESGAPGKEVAVARFSFEGERCWGFVRRRGQWVAFYMIGGPDWTRSPSGPWDILKSVHLESGSDWRRQELEPILFQGRPFVWLFPVLRKYERGDADDALVVDAAGFVESPRENTFILDGLPFRASVIQQENGLPQFLLGGKTSDIDTACLPEAA
jgi:hypothetical protein